MIKKNILMSLVSSLAFVSCDSMKNATPTVGNDANDHGCKASVGQTWSVVKNDCVRLFEDGAKFYPVVKKDTEFWAYCIISADGKKNEVFLPENNAGIVTNFVSTDDVMYENKAKKVQVVHKNKKTLIVVNGVDTYYLDDYATGLIPPTK